MKERFRITDIYRQWYGTDVWCIRIRSKRKHGWKGFPKDQGMKTYNYGMIEFSYPSTATIHEVRKAFLQTI